MYDSISSLKNYRCTEQAYNASSPGLYIKFDFYILDLRSFAHLLASKKAKSSLTFLLIIGQDSQPNQQESL